MIELRTGELVVIRDPKKPKDGFVYSLDTKDSAIVEDEVVVLTYKGKISSDGFSVT